MLQPQSLSPYNGYCENQDQHKAQVLRVTAAEACQQPDRNCRTRAREPPERKRQTLDSTNQDEMDVTFEALGELLEVLRGASSGSLRGKKAGNMMIGTSRPWQARSR